MILLDGIKKYWKWFIYAFAVYWIIFITSIIITPFSPRVSSLTCCVPFSRIINTDTELAKQLKYHKLQETANSKVGKLLDGMEFGSIEFNLPTHINISDSYQIQFLLNLSDTVKGLRQSITEAGEKIGTVIKLSDKMEAFLSGHMFQITEKTPGALTVLESQEAEWKWEIHPKKTGKHKLYISLIALLEIDGHIIPRTIKTFDREIEVTVTSTQKILSFYKINWHWLWAAILAPGGILGWFLNR